MHGTSVIILMARDARAMMTVVDFVVSRLVVVVDLLGCFIILETRPTPCLRPPRVFGAV